MRARITVILAMLAVCAVSCEPDDDYVDYVDESTHAILPLPDGGAVWACVRTWHGGYHGSQKTSVPEPISELLLLRTDAQRSLVWERDMENKVIPRGLALRADAGGGFSVAGFHSGFDTVATTFIIRTDSAGNPVARTNIGDVYPYGGAAAATADGGFAFFGKTSNPYFLGLIRTDAQDAVVVSREISVPYALTEVQDAAELADGKLIGAAYGGVILVSPQGDVLWTMSNENQRAYRVSAMPDGFAVCSEVYSYPASTILRLRAFTEHGTFLWSRDWTSDDWRSPEILLRTEPGFFIAGTVNAGGRRIFTITTDEDGGNSRQRDINVTGDDRAQTAAPLSGGGLLLGGAARVPHNDKGYGYDALLMWLDADGAPVGHLTFGI